MEAGSMWWIIRGAGIDWGFGGGACCFKRKTRVALCVAGQRRGDFRGLFLFERNT